MAKFGLFRGAAENPSQVLEGDAMLQKDEYVYIMKKVSGIPTQVGAIRLDLGDVVKQIED